MNGANTRSRRHNATARQRMQALHAHLLQLASRYALPGVYRSLLASPRDTDQDSAVAAPAWRQWYGSLRQADRRSLPALDALEARAARYRKAGYLPIALAHVHHTVASPALREAAHRFLRDGGALPTLDRSSGAQLELRTVLRAAPLPKQEYAVLRPLPYTHAGLTVRYVVPRELVVNNAAPLSAIEIDFGDGAGFRAVALDTPIEVTYPAAGNHMMRVRARAGTAWVGATSQLAVSDAVPPTPNEVWSLGSSISYNGVTATGYAFVIYGNGNFQLTNPLIMAEGFPGGYSLSTLWNIFNEQNLAQNLLARGYDLVLVAFDDGTTYVEANAGVVIAAIQRAISETPPGNQLIVGGASMGGLVARYALAYMEHNNLPHQTATYLSYDSPHLGANVPFGLQGLLALVYSEYPSEAPHEVMTLLASNAAQEMLITWVDPYTGAGYGSGSPLRKQLIDNFTGIGNFPAQPTLLGVSNGATDGTSNGTPAGSTVLSDDESVFSFTASTSPGIDDTTNDIANEVCYLTILGASGYLAWDNTVAGFDSAPGGTESFFGTLASDLQERGCSPSVSASVGCFIPTISALAMTTLSVYDNAQLTGSVAGVPSALTAWTGSNNDPHVTITAATAAWLLAQLPGSNGDRTEPRGSGLVRGAGAAESGSLGI